VIRAVSFFGPRSSGGGITGKGTAAAADPVVAGGRGAEASGAICAKFVGGETAGRVGKLMRTVSRFVGGTSAGVAVGCGGSAMRTVSFLGLAESAI
jgi:hypothetical protein